MFGNINANTLSGLAVGILVGVAATLATRSYEAMGAGNDFVGAWRAVAAPTTGGGPPVAWRINSVTGQMEMCAAGPQPKCVPLPGPGFSQ
ncbi:MAG TPA: hypothetical protein VL966_19305 [Alphaproteobacteria bacterium]|jgi:hypothetical protein|nr:hypothetical protein [Alphaproteobacteria bacterium]